MQELRELEARGEYPVLIREVRSLLVQDRRNFTDPFIKGWCARRWRNLFLGAAVDDAAALEEASRRRDRRPDRQRIAERFLVGEAAREWTLEMPAAKTEPVTRTTLVFSPGLLNGLLPVRAFEEALPAVERSCGCRVLRADLHPLRGSTANVEDLELAIDRGIGLAADARPIEADTAEPPGEVFFIGYSKGVPDTLALLVRRPELRDRVRCLFSWAGAVGGSSVAEGVQQKVERFHLAAAEDHVQTILRGKILRPLGPPLDLRGPLPRLAETDLTDAIEDLTPRKRQAFLHEHEELLDSLDIPMFTFAASASFFEVPWFQQQGYLKLRWEDAHNDMQLTAGAARLAIPMAADLGLVHGHHWDVAYGPFPRPFRALSRNLEHPFPKTAALLAMVRLAAELGLIA